MATTPLRYCSCAVPLPREQAIRKGASTTVCDRCGLQVRSTFGGR